MLTGSGIMLKIFRVPVSIEKVSLQSLSPSGIPSPNVFFHLLYCPQYSGRYRDSFLTAKIRARNFFCHLHSLLCWGVCLTCQNYSWAFFPSSYSPTNVLAASTIHRHSTGSNSPQNQAGPDSSHKSPHSCSLERPSLLLYNF